MLGGIDDVASHIASSNISEFKLNAAGPGTKLGVSLVHNPSHLEAANPVGMGKTRAK